MATLTVLEVAALLKVGENRVRDMAASGELPAFRFGRAWGFIESEILNWLAQRVAEQTAERQLRIAESVVQPLKRRRGRQRKQLPPIDLIA